MVKYLKDLQKMISFSLLQIIYIVLALLFFVQSNYIYGVISLMLAVPFFVWAYKITKKNEELKFES